ncbi:MAG: tetratricopeptide repeat protein, partial [Planctomycetota bacterium]
YMSPEQAGSGASDVDSRTDIYSLGVVLFRLLTGRLPFGNRLRMASIRDLQKILLEEDPERPSSTIDSHGHRDLRVAELRRETPRGLARRLRGDLDWIVLRAIARERDRRYASVSELIADIERALAGERVLAGPDSSWYRIRSFTRRHRIAVVTGSLVLSAILVGGILAGWQAVRASRSERAAQRSALSERTLRLEAEKARQESDRLRLEAEQSRSEALEARSDAEASRDRAREAAAAQEAINQFLLDMFEVANTRNLGPEAKIIDALAWSTKEIPERFSGRPRIAASLHGTIGNTYRSLAQLEKAEAAHLAAVALRRELGEKVPLAAALNSLAVDYRQLGRFEDAQKAYEESLSLTEGATDEEALSFRALATFNQAQLYTALGQPELAEPLLEESLAIHEEIYPDDAEKQGLMLASLGRLAKARGRFDEGVPIMERSVEQFRKAYDRPHPYLAVALNDLGIAYSDVERHGDALECFTEALEIGEQTLGPTHPHLAMYLNNRASAALNQEGSLEDAEADLSRAMELAGEGGSAATFQIAASLKLQGSIFIRQAKVKEAEQALRRALTALDGRVPPRDDLLLECQSLLGQSLTLQGQYEEAEPLLLRMLEGPPGEVLPPEMVRLGYRRVVEFYSRRGDVERAEEWRKKRDADPLLR